MVENWEPQLVVLSVVWMVAKLGDVSVASKGETLVHLMADLMVVYSGMNSGVQAVVVMGNWMVVWKDKTGVENLVGD